MAGSPGKQPAEICSESWAKTGAAGANLRMGADLEGPETVRGNHVCPKTSSQHSLTLDGPRSRLLGRSRATTLIDPIELPDPRCFCNILSISTAERVT